MVPCLYVGTYLHPLHCNYSHLPAKPTELCPRVAVPCSCSTPRPKAQKAALHLTRHSDMLSNVFNGLCRAQSSNQWVITSFACSVEVSLITLALQSEGKAGRKDADRRHRPLVSLLLAPVHSNEKQAEFLLPQQPWSLFEAIWRQLNEKE